MLAQLPAFSRYPSSSGAVATTPDCLRHRFSQQARCEESNRCNAITTQNPECELYSSKDRLPKCQKTGSGTRKESPEGSYVVLHLRAHIQAPYFPSSLRCFRFLENLDRCFSGRWNAKTVACDSLMLSPFLGGQC